MIRRGPGCRLGLDHLQRQPHGAGAWRQDQTVEQRYLVAALRRERQRQVSVVQGFTSRLHLPAQRFVIGLAEQVFAGDAHPQRRG